MRVTLDSRQAQQFPYEVQRIPYHLHRRFASSFYVSSFSYLSCLSYPFCFCASFSDVFLPSLPQPIFLRFHHSVL